MKSIGETHMAIEHGRQVYARYQQIITHVILTLGRSGS